MLSADGANNLAHGARPSLVANLGCRPIDWRPYLGRERELRSVRDFLEEGIDEGKPRVALVIGWDDAITAQIEGVADVLAGPELARLRDVYFGPYPDGRDRLAWPGITHVRVRPTWVRVSDFTRDPPSIVELRGDPFV